MGPALPRVRRRVGWHVATGHVATGHVAVAARLGRLLAGVCALAVVRAGTAGGQAPVADPPSGATTRAAAGVIEGRVLGPDEQPVRGAAVRMLGPAGTVLGAAVSDSAGRFTLRGVPAGVLRLEVRRLGYAPRVVRDIVARAAKPAEMRVVLTPTPAVLAGVTARPSYFPVVPDRVVPVSTGSFTAEEMGLRKCMWTGTLG